jgi:membrane-associated phospholipid phosphatase
MLSAGIPFILFSFTDGIGVFRLLNQFHHQALDIFFTQYTFSGDGVVSISIVLLLIIAERHTLSLQILTGYISSGLIVQLIKKVVIAPRPAADAALSDYSYFFEGLTHSGLNSFPSGHTTSAFVLATLLALHSKNKITGIGYFLLAALCGYSRIYLGQHFLQDVVAGAYLGVFTALLIYLIISEVRFQPEKKLQI